MVSSHSVNGPYDVSFGGATTEGERESERAFLPFQNKHRYLADERVRKRTNECIGC